jgi:hypothetical protein
MHGDYLIPIALLRAPDDQIASPMVAWANDSRGRSLLNGQAGYLISEAKKTDWYRNLSKEVRKSIEHHEFSEYRAWFADRFKSVQGRCSFGNPQDHVTQFRQAKQMLDDAKCGTQSPFVYVPLLAWQRAFKDDTERRDIAIRDFRVLCSLYSWIGESPARIVRRPAIIQRAFGFWAKEHTQEMIQSRIQQSLERGFTPRMIRDSLERLDRCGEIIRISPSETVTWYARGSSDPTVVVDHIEKREQASRANRSKSEAAQQLWELTEKRKQEGTK